MRDVYAGDQPSLTPLALENLANFTIHFEGDADPDVLLRVASQLLLSNALPNQLILKLAAPGIVVIDAALHAITQSTAESVKRKLMQLTSADVVHLSRSEPARNTAIQRD